MDIVGAIIERASGLSLDDYFQKFIFEPAGIKNLGFYLSEEMEKGAVGLHLRGDGDVIPIRKLDLKEV